MSALEQTANSGQISGMSSQISEQMPNALTALVFPISSITKSITATVAMILVADGDIS
jgi:CubicO group peptidase (beta-lactamase class C family)